MAAPFAQLELRGAHVAVQGFGAVGIHAAGNLCQMGAVLVAAADSRGAIYNPSGLDIAALIDHKRRGAPVHTFEGGRSMDRDALVGVDCDIWIPAARPDVLTADNIGQLRARLVLQGANIPATAAAERWMHEQGILNIPDVIANAGGVICAAVEYQGGAQQQALAAIAEKVRSNTAEVLARATDNGLSPRAAAIELAHARVAEAMRYHRP